MSVSRLKIFISSAQKEIALTDGFVITVQRKPELAVKTVGGFNGAVTGEVTGEVVRSESRPDSRLEPALASKILFILKNREQCNISSQS